MVSREGGLAYEIFLTGKMAQVPVDREKIT